MGPPEGLSVSLGVDGDTKPIGSEGDCVGSELVGTSVGTTLGTVVSGTSDGEPEVIVKGAFVLTTTGVNVVGIPVGSVVVGFGASGEAGKLAGTDVGLKDEAVRNN